MESLSAVYRLETCGLRNFDLRPGEWMKALGRPVSGSSGRGRVSDGL